MKACVTLTAGLGLLASPALAGGLDRSFQSVTAIFAAEDTARIDQRFVWPSVTGRDIGGGGARYDVGQPFSQTSASLSGQGPGGLSYAVILDQPYGTDVDYGADPTTSALGGTGADVDSLALTFVARYRVTERFSLFAGVGAQRIGARVDLHGRAYRDPIAVNAATTRFNEARMPGLPRLDPRLAGAAVLGDPAAQGTIAGLYGPAALAALGADTASARAGFFANGGYSFEMEDQVRPNMLIGAAWEIPDIALRIAGTYRFATEYSTSTVETLSGRTTTGTVDFVTPQSVNLEAQTGIAPGTLLTASYRWTDFSEVDIVPRRLGQDLVNLNDTHRYTLGIGRQVTDRLAASATLIFEPESDTTSPLTPTDGLFGIALGARYQNGSTTISGGIGYSWLGDADAVVAGQPVVRFTDNHAVAVGFEASMTF